MVEPMFVRSFDSIPMPGQLIELSGTEAKHAISVRRMRVGESIQLTDGSGLRVRGQVKTLAGNSMAVQIDSVASEKAPDIRITLVQALAKGDRDELAIQAATELGIMGVIPWEADRSVSRWIGLKEAKGVERWQSIVTEAAKQSMRSWHPKVQQPARSSQFADLFGTFDQVLVLDPTAPAGLAATSFNSASSVALVVGPEGGISESELLAFQQAGAIRVNLGEPILRTSTAGIAAISAILALTGQWGSK